MSLWSKEKEKARILRLVKNRKKYYKIWKYKAASQIKSD